MFQKLNFMIPATSCPGLELLDFQWNFRGSSEKVFFYMRADVEPLLDFLESIAWLSAALRSTNRSYSGFSVSDICSSYTTVQVNADVKRLQLRGWLRPMIEVKPATERCWHSLFKSPTFVKCDNGREDAGDANHNAKLSLSGYGIKLGLREMIALSGADLLLEFEGGMVYFGFTSILVPLRKLQDGALQWHLVSQSKQQGMISLASIYKEQVCKGQDLKIDEAAIANAKAHYLGLWPEALIMLGTAGDENYTSLKQEAYAADEKVKVSDTLTAGLGVNLATGAPTATVSTSATFAKSQVPIDPNYRPGTVLLILNAFQRQSVLIYETSPQRQRAWLVPKLSLVLHAAHICFRAEGWDLGQLLPYAGPDANGDVAAWTILRPNNDFDSVQGYNDYDGNNPKNERKRKMLEYMLSCIVGNMLKLDAKLVDQGLVSRVHGYDFARLPSDPKFSPVHTDFEFLPSRQGWWLLTQQVPLYLVHEMAPPVRPRPPADQPLDSPLKDLPKDYLICPVACLATLNKNSGQLSDESKLSDKLSLHCPHQPFGECTCGSCTSVPTVLDTTSRALCITRKSDGLRRWNSLAEHMSSAILISSKGRILHKSSPGKQANGSIVPQHQNTAVVGEAAPQNTGSTHDHFGNMQNVQLPKLSPVITDGTFTVDFGNSDDTSEIDKAEESHNDGQPGPSSGPQVLSPDRIIQAVHIQDDIHDENQQIPPPPPSNRTRAAEYSGLEVTWVTGSKGKEPAREAPKAATANGFSPARRKAGAPEANNKNVFARFASLVRASIKRTRPSSSAKAKTKEKLAP
jgi:hypothetical protein